MESIYKFKQFHRVVQTRPFQRSWCHARSISNTKTAGLPCFFLKVFLRQPIEFSAILFLNGDALSVELLDFIQPLDPICNLPKSEYSDNLQGKFAMIVV